MGRHSAPDDEERQQSAVALADAGAEPDEAAGAVSGRHSVLAPTDPTDPPSQADPAPDPATHLDAVDAVDAVDTESQPERAARREGATHADLRLLREQPALRARAAAAVLVPFVLYTVALVAVGQLGAYLLWVWIPAVVAGVSVGALLDLAHRRATRPASADPIDPAEPAVVAEPVAVAEPEPTEATDSGGPTEPTEATDSVAPAEPTEATDSGGLTEPTEPAGTGPD